MNSSTTAIATSNSTMSSNNATDSACRTALLLADINQNQRLEQNEFHAALGLYYASTMSSPASMLANINTNKNSICISEQSAWFNSSCLCRAIFGSTDPTCCVNNVTYFVPTPGVFSDAYTSFVCQQMQQVINCEIYPQKNGTSIVKNATNTSGVTMTPSAAPTTRSNNNNAKAPSPLTRKALTPRPTFLSHHDVSQLLPTTTGTSSTHTNTTSSPASSSTSSSTAAVLIVVLPVLLAAAIFLLIGSLILVYVWHARRSKEEEDGVKPALEPTLTMDSQEPVDDECILITNMPSRKLDCIVEEASIVTEGSMA
jgi:hypothetical protein